MNIEQRIDNFLFQISNLNINQTGIVEIVKLFASNVASVCLLMQENKVIYQHKITPEEVFKNEDGFLMEEINVDGMKYRLYFTFEPQEDLDTNQKQKLRSLFVLIGQVLSISNVAKERISEFQIINELNLNVITTLDLNRVMWFAENAARRLLATQKVYLYYAIEDHFVGRTVRVPAKFVPDEVYRQISRSRQILKLDKTRNGFLRFFLKEMTPGMVLIVPFTIKNEGRGFFLLDEFDKVTSEINAIMKLKFLGNQASIALERIELFQALNRTLEESRGLQEIAKLLLSPYELKHFFTVVLRRAQKILGFKKIMCSVYDPQTETFERFHGVGISPKKFREAKKVHPPYNLIKNIMQDRFRISNSYYVPSEEVINEIREYQVYKTSRRQKRIHDLWAPGDILLSPIYSRSGEILGILSLADPVDNRIPDRDKIRLLEAFGDFLGLAIENNRLFEKNLIISYTDELTGVYNYRFLREKLNELIEKSIKSIAIAMIDLDQFKEYNDRYGHLAGDQLLKKVSQILRDVIKDGYVTRYGGDEFIIILPDAGIRAMKIRLKQVRNMIEHQRSCKKFIRFSSGIAVYPEDGKDFGTLIDAADKRLYLEKKKKYEAAVS
ncbi:MAG: sensor domain-containing diguanylate cyclase [candidate division WOR-3 bacterium]|nr:sensor domain-containing diguanylate cyclase [candidate division WOR-3 bacterium]